MMKNIKYWLLVLLLLLNIITNISPMISKAETGLQSKGKIVYTDEVSGEEIVLDTNDHKLLKNNIDANGVQINDLEASVSELNTRVNNISKQDFQWYIDNGWLPPIPEEGEVPQNLEDCSWNMIQQLVASDTFKNYYSVGDTKSITLSTGEVIYMQVASINNGEGDAGAWYPKGTVDFISRDCLPTPSALNNSGIYGNIGGWSGCSLRTQLNTGILNTLPIDVINVIVEKTHEYFVNDGNVGDVDYYVEVTDKLWLPTTYEIFGANPSAYSIEKTTSNQMYPIFANSNTVKTYIDGTSASWWTPSSSNSNVANAHYISTAGASGIQGATSTNGVLICFRVG